MPHLNFGWYSEKMFCSGVHIPNSSCGLYKGNWSNPLNTFILYPWPTPNLTEYHVTFQDAFEKMNVRSAQHSELIKQSESNIAEFQQLQKISFTSEVKDEYRPVMKLDSLWVVFSFLRVHIYSFQSVGKYLKRPSPSHSFQTDVENATLIFGPSLELSSASFAFAVKPHGRQANLYSATVIFVKIWRSCSRGTSRSNINRQKYALCICKHALKKSTDIITKLILHVVPQTFPPSLKTLRYGSITESYSISNSWCADLCESFTGVLSCSCLWLIRFWKLILYKKPLHFAWLSGMFSSYFVPYKPIHHVKQWTRIK